AVHPRDASQGAQAGCGGQSETLQRGGLREGPEAGQERDPASHL
ncbi:MAG: hypothetical protein AVDCRST_MAG28-893, partial [uncultured Rubrobacteraceae bacterium]